jgi:hypothetical protein
LRPSLPFQFPRPQPPPFSPITGCFLFCDHANPLLHTPSRL